jgi:hypothetical protein
MDFWVDIALVFLVGIVVVGGWTAIQGYADYRFNKRTSRYSTKD